MVNAESECFQNAMDCDQLLCDDDCLEEHLSRDGHRGVLISSSSEPKSKILICADTQGLLRSSCRRAENQN